MKKLILVAAIAAATSSAFAMEAMDESTLSETTGQAGLTISQSGLNLTIGSVRYLDTDGLTAAQQTALGSPTATAGYTTANNKGVLAFNTISLGATTMDLDIDVASTGNVAGSRTGLILNQAISGLTFDVGSIKLDNGDHTSAAAPNAASNGSLGGFKLANLDLGTGSAFLITPKAGASGIVIESLKSQNISVNLGYYDTDVNAAGTAGADGYVKLPTKINNLNSGSITVDVTGGATGGLQLAMGATTIGSVELGNNGAGNDQVMIGTTNIGRVGINTLSLGASTLTVRGH